MPPNCRCNKNKLVFKIKHNSEYQASLVACGHSQVPCVNIYENYSPVMNNTTFFILLLKVIHFRYSSKIVNIETAFLYTELEGELYMECPLGISEVGKDDCIILNNCIYGRVYMARQYHKKAHKIQKNWGFIEGNIEPCFYVKKSSKGVI